MRMRADAWEGGLRSAKPARPTPYPPKFKVIDYNTLQHAYKLIFHRVYVL